MAKPRGQRDNNLTSLLSGAGPTPLLSPMRWQAPLEVEDHRLWHPELEPSPRLFNGIPATLGLREPRLNPDRYSGLRRFPTQTRAITAFNKPDNVMMCVRRKQRREILFAKRKTRKGSQSKRRYNYRSFIKC